MNVDHSFEQVVQVKQKPSHSTFLVYIQDQTTEVANNSLIQSWQSILLNRIGMKRSQSSDYDQGYCRCFLA
jgi:hypothetical protein